MEFLNLIRCNIIDIFDSKERNLDLFLLYKEQSYYFFFKF